MSAEQHRADSTAQTDLIVIGAGSQVIPGEPLRDRERLIWTLDLRPA